MSRRNRTRYLGVLRRDDSPLTCVAWASVPGSRTEDIGHVIFGKSAAENTSNGLLELARYDFESESLSEAIFGVPEEEPPQSVAVHPGGDGVICSFQNSCKLYDLGKTGVVRLSASHRDLFPLQNIGPQNCLLFSADGSRLATGGKDGTLRVFEWPSLKIIFDQSEGCKFLKDLDLSLDGAFLASIPDGGNSCRVWDLEKSTLVTTIVREDKGETFGSCRYSRDGTKPFLFIAVTKAGNGSIGVWEMEGWSKVGLKTFSRTPITAFAMSLDGKRLAIGSAGDIHVIEVKKMERVEHTRDAHMSPITSLEFSPNGRALLSMSADSAARVNRLNIPKEWKEWQIYLLLAAMFLGSAILSLIFFEFSDSFWKFPLGQNQPVRPPIEAIYGRMAESDK